MLSLGAARNSGNLLIVAGLLLGIVLIVVGIMRFRSQAVPAPAIAPTPQRVTQLVTAARPLQRGQTIRAADLKSTAILGSPPAGALTSPAQAAGRIALADIPSQQLLLASTVSSNPAAGGLAMLVPAGRRAISIDTTDEIAVAGFLRPGDVVDIVIVLPKDVFGLSADGPDRSLARTLLQNVAVLAVGPTLGQPGTGNADPANRTPPSRTLTLALLPEQVGLLTLARKLGQFYLTLRHPGDRAVTDPGGTRLMRLLGGGAGPVPAGVATPRRRPAEPRAPVELIVGGERQILYPGGGAR